MKPDLDHSFLRSEECEEPFSDPGESPLWGVTCYFNPIGYHNRLKNYRIFRKKLTIPLVAVELYYGDKPDLRSRDAEILIQLQGTDVLWQKEHLLSIALKMVPRYCKKIVWLDCDLIFSTKDWAERVDRLLDQAALVQVFGELYELYENADIDRLDPTQARPPTFSIAQAISHRLTLDFVHLPLSCRLAPRKSRIGTGIGWGFRRDIYDEQGFYNGSVVGGNDRAMVYATFGKFDTARKHWRMNKYQFDHYLEWAEEHYYNVRGDLTYLNETVFHLWHGELQNRSYGIRHLELSKFNFNPFKDVASDSKGVLSWNSNKKEMHHFVRQYFESRREDG